MICQQCGGSTGRVWLEDTVSVGPSGRFHGNTTVMIRLCPRCALRRKSIFWCWILGVGMLVAILGILAAIGW